MPWWAYPIAVPAAALVIEAIRRVLKLKESPVDPQVQRKETVPLSPQQTVERPSTTDGKLELAERYVALLEETKREQAADIERLEGELATMKGKLDWLERRDREKQQTIDRLLDRLGPPPQQPPWQQAQQPPSSPGWTPPPAV